MSELREAMVDKILLKGFTPRTQKIYLDAVSLLARHYHTSPDQLDQDAIQNWFCIWSRNVTWRRQPVECI